MGNHWKSWKLSGNYCVRNLGHETIDAGIELGWSEFLVDFLAVEIVAGRSQGQPQPQSCDGCEGQRLRGAALTDVCSMSNPVDGGEIRITS